MQPIQCSTVTILSSSIDKSKKHNVVFKFDEKSGKWYVEFEEMKKSRKEEED